MRLSRISLSILQISTTLIAISAISSAPANAACATDFPTVGWQAIRLNNGDALTDPANDPGGSNKANQDITSVNGSPVDWFSSGDGCDFFFRIRLRGTPSVTNGIDNNIYMVALGRTSSAIVLTGVNGGGANATSNVYVYTVAGGTTWEDPVTGNGVTSVTKIKVESAGGSEYFLEWRVPNSRLPASVFTSPVGLFAGTSQSNSLSAINRDCLDVVSACNSLDFTKTLAVDLNINTDSAVRPNITLVSPNKGTSVGGTTVSILGTNLANTSQVYFGGTAASITSSSNDSITVSVTTPSGGVGTVDVYVVTPGGTSNTLTNAYTYIAIPTVQTDSATAVAATSAQLNGLVKADADTSTVSFCYGTSNTLSGCTLVTASQSPVLGNVNTQVSYNLSGLTTNTTYYFQVRATNSLGTTNGLIKSFVPVTTTLAITNSSIDSGTVGTIYSFGLTATGGTGTYSSWAITSGTLRAGLTFNTTTGVISGTPSETVTAQSLTFSVTDNLTQTATKTLTVTVNPGVAAATTNAATSVAATSATLNGSITANGTSTTITFCVSTSGSTTAGALTCASKPIASNNTTAGLAENRRAELSLW